VSVDLHTHTIHSDGTLTPKELVTLAGQKKLSAIAITDHDITSGNVETLSYGKEIGIKVVPGVELSVDYPLPGNGHLHILGLFIDPNHPLLNKSLQNLRHERLKRNIKILNRLRELGREISEEDLTTEAGVGTVGRPHIAAAMVKKGYVKSIREAFHLFLKKGSPAYFDRVRLQVDQAIDLIHLSGGIAIIAHPVSLGFSSFRDACAYILELKKIGLDGLEVYCSGQEERKIQEMLKFARNNALVVSGGSDFHGSVKPEIQLGTGRGKLNVPDQVYFDLVKYCENINF
jgi:predicted metal-dependent phosphoesterase TrpH